ncbi:MAG: DUF302 domain-containing protein [Ignavibacteria bacterium]|nr:DUF302 domain-containing protein [Ignavibacteria bacterium]
MHYLISQFTKTSFDDTITKLGVELRKEGFRLLTELNISETIRKELNIEFGNYRIIGACHPSITYRALLADKDVGVMFPFNFVVRELKNGQIRVSAVNPVTAMKSTRNYKLIEIANEISFTFKTILERL